MPTNWRPFTFLAPVAVLIASIGAKASGDEGQTTPAEKERELIATLRSDAAPADKALACKYLAIYGSDEAVPELARLLVDDRLASWARIALETIPGPAAGDALQRSLDSLQGKLLVGAINSLGVRRDANSVGRLTEKLTDGDLEVASAAAVALGHIGNAEAVRALRQALAVAPVRVRSAVAEGCGLCADGLLSVGHAGLAAAIYDEVRKADVPRARKLEATRGAILARKDEGIPLLVELLQSPDKGLVQLALGTARELPGRRIDEALAAFVPGAPADRAALVIDAMADRKETVVLAALLKAAEGGPEPVRLAAIGALGRVGDASCFAPLLKMALESDDQISQTAHGAVASLPDPRVDQEIVRQLQATQASAVQGRRYPLLLELVGQRRIDALGSLLKALEHSDQEVRHAALISLGATIPAAQLSTLISQAVAPVHAEDAASARQALKAACVRMPDREACARELAQSLKRAEPDAAISLVQILGAVGGAQALETLSAAARGGDSQLEDASSRALGEWTTTDAAPVLFELAQTGPEKYRVRALRGYLRIARQFAMPLADRLEMCERALTVARQPAEQRLVLDVLKRYPDVQTLALACRLTRELPDAAEAATDATLGIAQKVRGRTDEVRELLSQAVFEKTEIEIVKAEYGTGSARKDVTEAVRKLARNVQLISLPAGTYKSAFGDESAAGGENGLSIQYRINGKEGEVSFAENALIILPLPK
ncbi:MAG: HEAT repeat domain-containing protein [Planctomycetaceae bacterium]